MIGNMVDPCRFVRLGAHFGIRTIAWTVNLPDVDANWVVIGYPFDEVTAKGMEKYAKKNYKHLNPPK